jgi:hypothetical protein
MSQKPCAKAIPKNRLPREDTPTQSRGRATRVQPRDSFQVVIQCDSESEQERLYHEFRSRNLVVRLLTM